MIRRTAWMALTLLSLAAVSTLAAASGYKREVVASIPYGPGSTEIRVRPADGTPGMGPDHVAGDMLGNVFLASSAQQQVRKFDSKGHPVFSVTANGVDQISNLVPDNLGGVWVSCSVSEGTEDAVIHYDASGRITLRTLLTKLVARKDLWFGLGPLDLSAERIEGILRIKLGPEAKRLARDGRVRGTAPTALEDDTGRAFLVQEIKANTWEIQNVNKYKSALSTHRLSARLPRGAKPSQARFASVPIGMDGAGNLYIVWHLSTKARAKLRNGLTSWSDLVVQRYSPDGRFLSEINVGRSWDYENSPSPTIDRLGRIYTLDFTNDGARIIRWSPARQ